MIRDDSIQTNHRFICLHGQGGTGKSVMMNKAMLYSKSLKKIALACASTNLAANAIQNNEGYTVHTLFGYPVLEDQDVNDAENKEECQPSQQRLELLNAADVIFIDEFFNLPADIFEAIVR